MIIITVCAAECCRHSGSYNVIQAFQHYIVAEMLYSLVEVRAAYCLHEERDNEVSVKIDNKTYFVRPENARLFFKKEVIPLLEDMKKYMMVNLKTSPKYKSNTIGPQIT